MGDVPEAVRAPLRAECDDGVLVCVALDLRDCLPFESVGLVLFHVFWGLLLVCLDILHYVL